MYQSDDVIENRYRLLEKVGAGAHGVVFRARDLESGTEVAIKILSREIARNPTFVERLQREAVAMARLRGTAAVYVHALLNTPAGLFLVMEFLRGKDLQTTLDLAEQRGGILKPDRMLALLRPIATTLDVAHRQGIVHRDVKPSNIFVIDREAGGGVRLVDFGLVKMMDAAALTEQGQVAGTPSYLAPECWKGNPLSLDHRIDVYSLGVLVFRALGGKVPYKPKGLVDMLEWALRGQRPSLWELRPDLPAAIDAWVNKSLAISPDARYQDIPTMWTALETVLAEPKSPF
ncbi:MAG: hypothetical protein RJA70_1083 [Pseudomonadota bacterium]|jgi:serine/threonine-protein kinase